MTGLVPASNFRYERWIIIALAFFAFAASVIFSRTVFDRLPHLEDELAYVFQAEIFARGDVAAPAPTPITPFWQPFVIDYPNGTRFSKYPPGWSAMLAFGTANGAGWLINALLSALNVALVYRLAQEIFGREAGIFAAGLLAFSPMALLLNATLMNHTAALTFTLLFMWAGGRMMRARGRDALWWGAAAGIGLGAAVTMRPLSAAGIAAPFILWHGLRVLRALFTRWPTFWPTLKPLLALSAATLAVAATIPLYNAATTGDAFKNLYTLIPGWHYDRVGFGPEIGRNGHTLEKGIAHMRYDLSLTAADLFGWQWGTFTPEPASAANTRVPDYERDCNDLPNAQATLQQHLRTCSGYYPVLGLSWVLMIPALLIGFRRNWAWVWAVIGVAWLLWMPGAFFDALPLWVLVGIVWALAPLVFVFPRDAAEPRAMWTWLLFGMIFALIAAHVAYWVGSQRYSTRYYFEALGAAVLLSALPLAWLVRELKPRIAKAAVYAGFAALCLWSFTAYSVPRIAALYGFNRVSQMFIDTVDARRTTDAPLLVLMTGTGRVWRSGGALLAVTGPYLDSDIVFAWYDDTRTRDQLAALFPDREIIEMRAWGEDAWFAADCTGDQLCPIANDPARPLLR